MSYSKYYNPTNWENYPSEDTAINAMHLNNLEDGVDTLDDRIVALSTDKSEVSWNQTLISGEKIAEITVNGITKDVYAPEISDSVVEQAAEQALKSEGYAVGTQGDVPVTSGLYYHNNSKYYSEQASDSASDASASAVEAGQSADGAEEEALVSEGWAVGEQNGVPVPSTSPYYHNNSKYYSEQSDPTALANLSDVNFGTLKDDEIIVYDATSQKWKNEVGVSADLKSNTTGQFNTRTGGILNSCDVKLEPIQDLHGYSKPWVGGSGKNKLPLVLSDIKSANPSGTWNGNVYSYLGLTCTVNTDADGNVTSIKINGTASSNTDVSFIISNDLSFLTVGTSYIFTSGNNTGSTSTYFINIPNGGSNASEITFSYATNMTHARIMIRANTSVTNQMFYPMIRLATVSDATFEPYTNICSITGHSSVEVDVCGINIFSPLSYETVDLNGQGAYRYGHEYPTGTYTIINKSAQQISYRLPKADLSDRGTTVNINANSSATVTVDSTHVLWVFMFSWDASVAEKICVRKDNDTTFVEFNGTDYTISLGQTVYGGSLDVVSGVLTVKRKNVKGSTLTWLKHSYSSNNVYYSYSVNSEIKTPPNTQTVVGVLSSSYTDISWDSCFQPNSIGMGVANNGTFCIANPDVATLTDFQTDIANVDICYELATPLTIQLTPQQINTLIGENHLDVPLEGQSLDSLSYREMMAWDDVEDVVKAVDDKNANISAIGTDESGRTTASRSYAQGEHFYKDGKFGKTKTAVAEGATWTLNTNYEEGDVASTIDAKSTNQLTVDSGGTLNSQACVTLGHIFIAVYVLTANDTTSVVSGFPTLVTQSNAPTALIRNLSNGQVMTTNNYIVNGKHTMVSLTSGTAYAVTIIGII